ncbi:MAG: sugar ABC transporter substrate-binding protein [Solirubrobacteraceae bacterium]
MVELSRREALRAGVAGLTVLMAAPVTAGCGRSGGAAGGTGTGVVSAPGPLLAPFDSHRPVGPPTGLPRRVAWANTADIEIFVTLGNGIAAAAADTGLGYLTANAAGDPGANINQIDTFLARGVGAMTIQPLDEAAQAPVMQRALDQGTCVIGIITHPCMLQIAADQYRIGYTQGRAAARYITSHLRGRATVFNMNQDQTSPQLALRNQGVLAGLRTAGRGVEVIDTFATVAQQSVAGAFALMQSVLQRHPSINVVLGDDTPVVGAYRAMEQTGQLQQNMYFSGVDGDAKSLALVKQGGPYRASLAFAWTLMGYGMGRFAADWIDGREIPRVMIANATLLDSPKAVTAFEADNAAVKGTFSDRRRYEQYLPLLGNVSYATRRTFWEQDYVPR